MSNKRLLLGILAHFLFSILEERICGVGAKYSCEIDSRYETVG